MPPQKFPNVTGSAPFAEPEGEEIESSCSCCGRSIFWGHGWLTSEDKSIAAYWYNWPTGHPGHFVLKLALFDEKDSLVPGVASVAAHIDEQDIHYSVLEPEEAIWSGLDLTRFGPALSRAQALAHQEHLFAVVDAIAARETRLASRILSEA
jgi:hypothetical protein